MNQIYFKVEYKNYSELIAITEKAIISKPILLVLHPTNKPLIKSALSSPSQDWRLLSLQNSEIIKEMYKGTIGRPILSFLLFPFKKEWKIIIL